MKQILKRVLSLALVLSMLLSVSLVGHAAGTETAKISMTGDATITAGSVTTFTASIANNPGIAGYSLVYSVKDENNQDVTSKFTHTGKWLTATGILLDEDDDTIGTFTRDGANLNWNYYENIYGDGDLCTIKLTADSGLVNGKYTIVLGLRDDEPTNLANKNYLAVPVEFVGYTFELTGGVDKASVTPAITQNPVSASYKFGQTADALSVAVSVGTAGELIYQWYSNTTNSNQSGTAIVGQTAATYMPVLSEYGTSYYYCVVTNTYNGQAFTATSEVAAITYTKADQEISITSAGTVVYGETLALTTDGGDGTGAVTYSVANGTGEATVSGSTLTPVKVGDVTVTATKAADTNYNAATATQTVTIQPAELTLEGSASYDVTVYTTRNLVALTVPVVTAKNGQTVTSAWAVTSGSGLITLNSTGTVTVAATASAAKGDKATVTLTYRAPNHNDKVVTYNITVQDKNDMSSDMTFTAKDATVTYDGTEKSVSTFVNAATVPEKYTGTITYTVKDNAGAVVASGTDLSAMYVTNAGTYTVTATYSDDENEGVQALSFTILRAPVAKPTAVTGLVYTGSVLQGVNYEQNAGYTMSGDLSATDAGSYTATATLDGNHQWNDNSTEPVTIQWSIAKATIDVSGWTWNYTEAFTYDGNPHSVTLNNSNEKVLITYQDNAKTDAGEYTAVANLSVKEAYQKNYTLSSERLTQGWEIQKKSVTVNAFWCTTTSFVYDGAEHSVTVTGVDLDVVKVDYTNNTASDAGNYTATATFSAKYPNNYTVTGTIAPLNWSITKASVEKPTAKTELTYNGQTQTGVNYKENAGYSMSGTLSAVNAGEYSASAKLDGNHQWTDTSTEDVNVNWSIAKKTPGTLEQTKSLRYSDTSEQTFTVSDIKTLLGDANPETNISITGVSTESDLIGMAEVTGEGHVVYALKSGLTFANQTAEISVSFNSNNYLNGTVTLKISLMDKNDVSDKISFSNGESPYNGLEQTYEAASMTDSTLTAGITYTYSPSEVKNAGTYTVTAIYEDADNYGKKSVTFTITKVALTINGANVASKVYDGTNDATVNSVSFGNLVNGESLTMGTDYTVSGAQFTEVDAGLQTVTFTVSLKTEGIAANYSVPVSSGSANATISPLKITVALGSVDDQTYTGSAIEPGVNVTGNGTVNGYALVRDTDYTVSYENNTNVGTATVKVRPLSGNYTFDEAQTTFNITKATPAVSANDMTVTYTGEAIPAGQISGTATFNGATISGIWSWVEEPSSTNASETPYGAKVRFTPDNENLNAVEDDIQVTITKADPTGEPEYTEITESGKTLEDAALGIGTIQPEGTIIWVDEEGQPLDVTTEIESGVAYNWLFTPNDTDNYNTLEGSIVLYEEPNVPPFISVKPSNPSDGSETETEPAAPSNGFRDVQPGDWYAEAVEMVVREGLFTGVSSTRFDPDGAMTRAMLVTVLWRLDGEPAAKGATGFQDVVKGSWYAEAVAWANENGIVNGYNETTFGTNDFITREQMAAILYRYASYAGVDVSARADLSGYADLSELDAYAEAPMAWAVAEGLITGLSASRLSPNGNATRAQVATILMRFVENIRK